MDQDLTSARGARLAGRVAIEKLTPVGGVRANPAADLVQYGPLVAGHELDLIAGPRCYPALCETRTLATSLQSVRSFQPNRMMLAVGPHATVGQP